MPPQEFKDMEPDRAKRRIRLGEIKKTSCCPGAANDSPKEPCCDTAPVKNSTKEPCCAPAPVKDSPIEPCCAPSPIKDAGEEKCCASPSPSAGPSPAARPWIAAKKVSTDLKFSDLLRHLRCRVSAFRMKYTVAPGLYYTGNPTDSSDVFVSANYAMSFDHLRAALKGTDSWILVLDTKGINVWCAAGKGTFGTDELVERIGSTGLGGVVSHRRVIVPQLGAPGIEAHTVRKKTGFKVLYGPVRAEDLKEYIGSNYKATREMRTVEFGFLDRLALTPMEINPAMKRYPIFALALLVIFGLDPTGISFSHAFSGALPFLMLGLVSVLAGALVTPLLLGAIPFRAFSVKGWLMGMLLTLVFAYPIGVYWMSPALQAASFLFFPAVSSYIAVNFTGSTVFTGLSGVKKELRYALPAYMAAAAATVILVAAYKLKEWGVV